MDELMGLEDSWRILSLEKAFNRKGRKEVAKDAKKSRGSSRRGRKAAEKAEVLEDLG
jgi:hypothetical protein